MTSINKIKINVLTYLFIILFLFSGFKSILLPIILIFVVHEMGHIFFCFLFKVEIIKIEIYPFGGIIKLNNLINYSPIKSLFVSLGGLLFQLILYVLNIFIIKNDIISTYNLKILLLNVMPIIPLDGSKILQVMLSFFFSFYKSLFFSYLISLILLVYLIIYTYNPALIIFLIGFLIKEICNFSYLFNRFLLERYLYDFKFKKYKYLKKCNLKKLCVNRYCFFFEKSWKSEKEILSKKFDNCSYIW